MTILATMPGHFGDILWSLPTVRLLAGRHETKVDFMVPPAFESILPLIQRQPYILETWTGKGWDLSSMDTAQNRVPPECDCGDYEEVYHLGYKAWPSRSLPVEIRESVGVSVGRSRDPLFDLNIPWIHTDRLDRLRVNSSPVVAVGFTNEHIELKMGLLFGLAAAFPSIHWKLLVPCGVVNHRAWEWDSLPLLNEYHGIDYVETTWEQAAAAIASADLFFGCLGGLWVLANAVGTPTVIMEPMEARHNPVFWRDTPKNHLVLGNDGKPTFDLRATRDMVGMVLDEV